MQNVTYIAASDLVIKCESGEIEYKKGQLVDICHNESGDVWISYHEESKEGKVEVFEIDITDLNLFSSLLENTVLVEEELDDKVSYEEMTIDTLLIEENVEMSKLLQHMVEANFTKAVRGGKVAKVPVKRVKQKISPKQKAARMKSAKALARNPQAKKQRMKSMKLRSRVGLGESQGYFIEKGLLFNNSLETVSGNVFETLQSFFGDKAKVKMMEESKISVNLFNSDEEQLIEALESLEVNYILEGTKEYKVVSFFKPQAEPVVESYYAEKKEADDKDSEDDMDDEMMELQKEIDACSDDAEKEKLMAKMKELKASKKEDK